MDPKPRPKPARFVFLDSQIVIECPFCGRTLLKTNYKRITKLLHYEGDPPGKFCAKCGGVAILELDSKARKTVLSKIEKHAAAGKSDSGAPLGS